jgi:hypothetical protein
MSLRSFELQVYEPVGLEKSYQIKKEERVVIGESILVSFFK